MRTPIARLAALVSFALAACSGGDGPVAPDVPEVPEVPEVPGLPGGQTVSLDEVLNQLNTVGSYAGAGLVGLGVAPAPDASMPSATACPYDATTTYFVCPTQTADGLTINTRYQLLTSGGVPMAAFNSATVSSLRYVVDVEGAIDVGDGTSISIDSHDEQTLSGLQTTTRVVNGTGTTDLSMTADGQTFAVATTRAINNLVLPYEPGPNAYPASGSITTTATADQVSFTSTITFHGTSTVTIVSTLNGSTQSCTFNLATPETPPVCS